MIIDCDRCAMQHTTACDDCVVSALLVEGSSIRFADAEMEAMGNLADAGLIAPIRLVPRSPDVDAASG